MEQKKTIAKTKTKKTIKKDSLVLPIIDCLTGEKSGEIVLPKEVFAVTTSPSLLAQAIRVYLANQRKAKAKAKTRGVVAGSGKKIWRQKGTGKARHGDYQAPIFRGGGVAHGPTGKENFKLRLPKKMRQKALYAALSQKYDEKEIIVVSGLRNLAVKTKEANLFLEKVLTKKVNFGKDKVLLVFSKEQEKVKRAFRNLPFVKISSANSLNTYEVLKYKYLVFSEEAIGKLIIKFVF